MMIIRGKSRKKNSKNANSAGRSYSANNRFGGQSVPMKGAVKMVMMLATRIIHIYRAFL